jgi:16S rRNA (adenine1518-N6/adenine1519-N6)-dimethyltransferase
VVRAGFGQRRKQLRNALRAGLSVSADHVEAMLREASITPERRAETLTLQEWSRLAWAWHESRSPTAARSGQGGA